MGKSRIIWSTIALCLSLVCLVRPASAAYPEHPIILIVPAAAGGSLDILAHVIAPVLSKSLGQPVVVETKAGADGLIGITAVADAKPDGYTILLCGGAETIAPALHRQLNYDPTKLATISQFAITPNMIVASAKLGIKTIPELVALAKSKPDGLNAAASGNGSRLSAYMFELATKTKIEVVSFPGTGQATTSLMSGETDFGIMDSLAFASMANSPTIRLLAVVSPGRLKQMPDVPTAKEAGVQGLSIGTIYGFYTAGSVPPDIVQKLYTAVKMLGDSPDAVAQLNKLNLDVNVKDPATSQKDYLDQLNNWKNVVREANVPMSN